MKRFHPDNFHSNGEEAIRAANEKCQKLNYAFEELETSDKRSSVLSKAAGFSGRSEERRSEGSRSSYQSSSANTKRDSSGSRGSSYRDGGTSSAGSGSSEQTKRNSSSEGERSRHQGSGESASYNWEDYDFEESFENWKKTRQKRESSKVDKILEEARRKEERPNLSKEFLYDIDLSDKDLSNVDFGSSAESFEGRFSGVNFSNCDLTGSSFENCRMWDNIFTGATIKDVNFSGADFSFQKFNNLTFESSNLSKANFKYAEISDIIFKDADLSGIDFSTSKLGENISFEGTTSLKGATFTAEQLDKLNIGAEQRTGVKYKGSRYDGSAKDAKFNSNGRLEKTWAESLRSEGMNARKGVVFAAGTAALGGVLYLAHKYDQKRKEDLMSDLSNGVAR